MSSEHRLFRIKTGINRFDEMKRSSMKKTGKNPDTLLAQQAMNRAALKVLQKAVAEKEPILIWDGQKTAWKVPYAEAERLAAQNPANAQR